MEDANDNLSKMATMNAIWEEYYGNNNNNNNVLADLTNYKKIGTEQKKGKKEE